MLDTTNDISLVKNSLIILLNLIGDLPLDRFEKAGKDSRFLSKNEREKLKELLRDTLVI
ncbi:MAG: hypothetical protein ACFE8M_13615 [Candidatus Hermodarchaeota archaeon]